MTKQHITYEKTQIGLIKIIDSNTVLGEIKHAHCMTKKCSRRQKKTKVIIKNIVGVKKYELQNKT